MPKKSFRSNNPTVRIKRNKLSGTTKRKVVNQRQKSILIDEKNESNWKYLKTELGYKTDSLFLEYLLNLAQSDLNFLRPKKRHTGNENEEKLNSIESDSSINNEKQSDSFRTFQNKSLNAPNLLESEKKKYALPKENDTGGMKIPGNSQFKRDGAPPTVEENFVDKMTIDSVIENYDNSFLPGYSNEKNSNWAPPEDESKKNAKTENAKDFFVDSITLSDRNREQNLDELSAFKDLTLQNSPGRSFFGSCEASSAIKDVSSHNRSNGTSVRNSKKGRGKINRAAKTDSQEKEVGKRKGRNDSKLRKKAEKGGSGSRRSNLRARLNEVDNYKCQDEIGSDSKSPIKMKLCMKCNKRHFLGKCQDDKSVLRQNETKSNGLSEQFTDIYSDKTVPNTDDHDACYANGKGSDNKNVYDFDDNERQINIDGSSRWCHKLLKTKDIIDDGSSIVTNQIKRAEMLNPSSAYGAPINNERGDSDSSDSELKLRIDEGMGENRSFAESSLPDYLILKTFDDEHGQTVLTKTPVSKSTFFGPLIGQKVREMDIADDFNMKFIWEVNSVEGIIYLSTKDPESSNWLRFLRPANSRDSANLISSVRNNQLYFMSTRDINEGEELIYWMDDTHSAWSKKKLEKKNCGGCNIQFSHPLYYRKHCMIFHDPSCSLTIRKYHCKICGLAVLGKEKIMKHAAELHQGKGAYQCQYCHKFFLRLNYLEMHRTYGCSKNPQRSRPLCDLCGRKFCQPQKLKVHIKRMHSDMAQVLKDFQCKSCLKILGSRAALQRHMKEVHNKDIVGACACDRCGKMFQNKSNLKIHMLTHSGVKPFKCQQAECTAAFTTKQCLQFHYKKVHGFTDDFIPKIERSIAYTFDAYSGGTVSEPTRCQTPKFEEYQSPLPEQRECCLDLSLVNSPEVIKGKEKVQAEITCQPESISPTEDPKIMQPANNTRCLNREEAYEKGLEHDSLKEEEMNRQNFNKEGSDENNLTKMMVSKGSKKWIVSETSNEKTDERFKSLFRPENANASLLVEAAISAAEKDIIDKPVEKLAVVGQENVIDTPPEIYPINQYTTGSPGVIYDPGEKKFEEYGKISMDTPKSDSLQDGENKKCFMAAEKNNFNDFLRCNSLLRINTSPINEMPKDYNISSIIRDQETEAFPDIEIQDYRNRDLLEAYRENEGFHEQYRTHDVYRNEKLDLYRSGESDLRMPNVEKFDYRDFDVSNETYRNLANNLEKYRNADIYRLRSDGYDLGVGYRDLGEERDGEAQNLCLKEKSFQYETLEELARIGRDNPGFECLLVGESGGAVANQSFGTGAPRLHGMLSPRPYHPTYEGESVDLSVPRHSYSSSPIYSLDLTPARVEIPTRHLDFRSHLALSPHRFPNSRLPGLSNGGSQLSPTGYGVYSSPYVAPAARHSPTCQFQPYTSLYY